MKAKLIKKLKKKACRTVKEIMMIKGTDRKNKLNNNDNLKNPTSTLKSLKNKSEFIKSIVLT